MERERNDSEISFKSDHRNKEKLSFTEKLLKKFLPDNTNFQNFFPFKYFSCCLTPKEEKIEISDLDIYEEDMYLSNEEIDGVMSLFPSKYLRKEERELLKFDRENILSFIKKLEKENFIRKFEKCQENGIVLRMYMLDNNKNFSNNVPVTRCQIEIPNIIFRDVGIPPVDKIGDAIINPNSRMQWDKDNFEVYKILKKINSTTETIQIITKEQMKMIIPREFYDKRTHFIEDGVFYSYSSSAPDSIRPPKKEPIRVMDYFGLFSVSSNDKTIFIESFHQIDIKIGQPGPLIFMSLPLKMTQFTENLILFLKGEIINH